MLSSNDSRSVRFVECSAATCPSSTRPTRAPDRPRRGCQSSRLPVHGSDSAPTAPAMIIQSLLDTDLYKFTMMQVVLHHFPGAQVEYRFKCRNQDVDLTPYIAEIDDEIRELCSAALHAPTSSNTCAAGASSRATSSTCWASFTSTSASSRSSRIAGSDGEIDITIKGPWLHTILFEVPVLAIVSEVYYRNTHRRARLRRRPPPPRRQDRADQRRRRSRRSASPTTERGAGSRAAGRTRSSAR